MKFFKKIILSSEKMGFFSLFLDYFKELFSHWTFRAYLISVLILNTANWLIAYYINAKEITDLTILHYNVDFGITFADSAAKAYYMPLLGLLIAIANLAFLLSSKERSRFLFHFFNLLSIMVNLLLSASLGFIYFINFR
jgi:hypothetical protein